MGNLNKSLDDAAFRLSWLTMRDEERHRQMQILAKEQGESDREKDDLIRRLDRYFRDHGEVAGLHMTCYDPEGRIQHYAILPDSVDGVALVNLQETWRLDDVVLPKGEPSKAEEGISGEDYEPCEPEDEESECNCESCIKCRRRVQEALNLPPSFSLPIDDEGMILLPQRNGPGPAREYTVSELFDKMDDRP